MPAAARSEKSRRYVRRSPCIMGVLCLLMVRKCAAMSRGKCGDSIITIPASGNRQVTATLQVSAGRAYPLQDTSSGAATEVLLACCG